MYNKQEYEEFIKKNENLTECQKKEFINTRQNIFYVDNKSNHQVVTYLNHAEQSKDFRKLLRLNIMFNHFLAYDFVEKLVNGIKVKKYADNKIYEYIIKHPEAYQKKKPLDKKIYCSPYTYVFEQISLMLRMKKFIKVQNPMYLDVSCGDGFQTKLFSQKLGTIEKNVWGTDITEWGPYKADKKNLSINFKPLENSKLNFEDNEFDILSILFALHHIPDDSIRSLLSEFHRVLKPGGILLILEHNIVNDYDHLIVDIEHSLHSYTREGTADNLFARYFNYMELDFILNGYGFEYIKGEPLTNNIGFDVRYDNPYYASYLNKKN